MPRILLALSVCVCACSFQSQPLTGDAMPVDVAPGTPVVGFAGTSSTVDHSSGTIQIPVAATGELASSISVGFRVGTGTTAVRDTDFTVSEGTLTFTTAGTQDIAVTILPETTARPDGTVVLELFDPTGATLGTATYTIEISANVLPQVSFQLMTSSVTEGAAAPVMIAVELDHASNVVVSVDFTVAGTASDPADYTIAPSPATLTFAPGETAKQLAVTVVDDTLAEDDETVIVTLTNPSAATLGTSAVHTLTIHDNGDPQPQVAFAVSAESSPEATPTVTLTVSLSIPSGQTITVPFSADLASTATDPADYSYATTTPLTFAPGDLTQSITLAVVNDTIDEPDETVITNLGAPTNATLGATPTNTMTIIDDDLACFGPTGAFQVCFDRGPTVAVALPVTINTDSSGLCEPTQPPGWTTTQGQSPACFIKGTTISVATTVVIGSRPLVLVASDTLTVTALLDASSSRIAGNVGPASPSSLCGTAGAGVQSSGSGGGGGAGGSFMTKAGNGGSGDGGNKNGGTAAALDGANPSVLRGGCDGAAGGKDVAAAGAPGHGGGALFLIAANTLVLSTAVIDASGAGAAGGGNFTGGSGAGSGGMIYLFGGTITTTGNTKVFANGGGGSGGGNNNTAGNPGGEPTPINVATPAAGGGGGGATGGNGFAGVTQATNGGNGSGNKGGGGGGGAGGFLESNLSLGAAKTSAGKITVP